MDEIYHQALKLLRRRDYSVRQIRMKLSEKFGDVPSEIIRQLIEKRFLDDRRFAENVVLKSGDRHPSRVREELAGAGVSEETADSAIALKDWPSLQSVLKAKMNSLRLRAPLHRREASRLFRILSRLGYEEDEIREELKRLHDE